MATVTIRNIPDEVHTAIKARAIRHGRSTEAEILDILSAAVAPPSEGMGDLLATIGARAGGVTLDLRRDAAGRTAPELS